MWRIKTVLLVGWALAASVLISVGVYCLIRRFVDRGNNDLPRLLHRLPLAQLRVRRWAFPKNRAVAAMVQSHLKELIEDFSSKSPINMAIVNEPGALSNSSVIIAFEKSGGKPVAAHVLLRSDFTYELVLVNCLLLVNPKIPKADQISRRLVWCNTLLSIHFSLLSFWDRVTVALISRSPRHIAGFSDTVCRGYIYPYFRHNPQHSEPAEWQRRIARSIMIDHTYHLGLAQDAQLDLKTFIVKRAFPSGHPALFCEECSEECQRSNDYCRGLLKDGTDAFILISRLHTLDALFSYWIQRGKIRVKALGGLMMVRLVSVLLYMSAICRWDGMFRAWDKIEELCHTQVIKIGESLRQVVRSDKTSNEVQVKGKSMSRIHLQAVHAGLITWGPPDRGILYVSNHFSWMDYPYVQRVSNLKLRTIIRADLSRLGIFGALASHCASNVGTILYRRGDKSSGDNVRKEIVSILQDEKMPVFVFPEGTSTVKGPVGVFKTGSFDSAKEVSAPIQPVTIWYSEAIGMDRTTDDLYQSSLLLERPLQVILKAHEPLYPSEFSSGESLAKECHRIISEEYERLSSVQAM